MEWSERKTSRKWGWHTDGVGHAKDLGVFNVNDLRSKWRVLLGEVA